MLDIDLILIKKFSELTGWTEAAIRTKISRGEWLEGKQWIKAPDGHVLISLQGYDQWVRMTALEKHRKQATRLTLPTEGKRAANESNSSPPPLIVNA